MSAELPNPMPDDAQGQERVEAMLGDMHQLDVQKATEGSKAEVDRIREEIEHGRPVLDIVAELGGLDQARLIIGEEKVEELFAIAKEQAEGSLPLNEKGEI